MAESAAPVSSDTTMILNSPEKNLNDPAAAAVPAAHRDFARIECVPSRASPGRGHWTGQFGTSGDT